MKKSVRVIIDIPLDINKCNRIKVSTNYNNENFRTLVPKENNFRLVPTLYKAYKMIELILDRDCEHEETKISL